MLRDRNIPEHIKPTLQARSLKNGINPVRYTGSESGQVQCRLCFKKEHFTVKYEDRSKKV